MSLLWNLDLCSVFISLSTFITSEPLSSTHRLASTSTAAAHRIRLMNFLYTVNHLKFFHVQFWRSLPQSAVCTVNSDCLTRYPGSTFTRSGHTRLVTRAF